MPCICYEPQLSCHCEVSNRNVKRFKDLIQRAEFLLQRFPIGWIWKRMWVHLHDTSYRKLLQLLPLSSIKQCTSEFQLLLEHAYALLGLVRKPLNVLVDITSLLFEILYVP